MKWSFFWVLSCLLGMTMLQGVVTSSPQETKQEGSSNSCSELPINERAFANQLDDFHQKLFCTFFTEIQRFMAMSMAGKTDSKGNVLSAENAVDMVAKEFDIVLPRSPEYKTSQGCPLK